MNWLRKFFVPRRELDIALCDVRLSDMDARGWRGSARRSIYLTEQLRAENEQLRAEVQRLLRGHTEGEL